MVLRGPYHIYMYACIRTQYLRSILTVKTAVGIMGPEHASNCYCHASGNSELAKNPLTALCQDPSKAYLHLTI